MLLLKRSSRKTSPSFQPERLNRRGASLSALAFFLILILLLVSACGSRPSTSATDEPTEPLFDALAFYTKNTVEIMAVREQGIIKAGTGLILFGEEYPVIVTCLHVSGSEGAHISVKFPNEDEFINANTIVNDNIIEVLSFDENLDLCIFKVDYSPLTLYNDLTLAIDGTDIIPLSPFIPEPNTEVISLGNPNGQGITRYDGSTLSLEESVETQLGTMTLLHTTIDIHDGCSGGAMFDDKGRLYGLTAFSGGRYGENTSFAIPVSQIYSLVNTL